MITRLIQQYKNSQRFKQVLSLYAVNIIGVPLSIVTSIIVTRYLGPVGYGDFKFLMNIFTLAVSIFSIGFFQAGNRALVLNDDIQKGRELYGAQLVILVALSMIMSTALLGYAFLDNNINEKGLRDFFIYLIPFSWAFLLVMYFEVLFQADNKIYLLAKSRLYPKLAYFISILIIYLFLFEYKGNRLSIIWISNLGTQILAFLYIIYKINPSFLNLKERIREIFHFNKIFGLNVYVGSLFTVSFGQLTGILISYFGLDNAGVGYFALALTITAPLGFIPNVIGTTHYKDFSTSARISKKLFLTTIAFSFSALVLIFALVGPFIKFFYGSDFIPVITLTYIVSVGAIFHGLADFVNRFLGSHGEGKALRNSSMIVGTCLLIFNIVLIPRFGETGAALTRILSGLIYFIAMLWFYRRLVKKLQENQE